MNTFNDIIVSTPDDSIVNFSLNNLNEIKNCLNRIFSEEIRCSDVLYTNNYDKLYFGIRVNPKITQTKIINIIANEEREVLNEYKIEFDSKLFNIGLSSQEIVAYTLHEIGAMIGNYQIIDDLRAVIDLNMVSNDDTIYLKKAVPYAQLIIFAIKDALTKLSSLVYKDELDEFTSVPIIQTADLSEYLVSARNTIIAAEGGPKDSLRATNTSILQWMFIMYKDMRTNSSSIMSTLKDAKTTTGSKLDIEEINKTINAIDRIDSTIAPQVEALELPKFFDAMNMSSLNERSLFDGLRRNGLRNIEDYLYEAQIRIKNLETEEDAMYVLRGINTRMGILVDYMYNTPGMNPRELAHWEDVYDRYAALRNELTKKKIWNKKQYGLFFDYNQDFGDKPYKESSIEIGTLTPTHKYDNLSDEELEDDDIETELENISFDENGEAVIKEGLFFKNGLRKKNNKNKNDNNKVNHKNYTTNNNSNYTPEEMKIVKAAAKLFLKKANQYIKEEFKDPKKKQKAIDYIANLDFSDYDKYKEELLKEVKKCPKFEVFEDVGTGGYYVICIDCAQEVNIAFSDTIWDTAKKLENDKDIAKLVKYSIYTGDGDEGCIYITMYSLADKSTNESSGACCEVCGSENVTVSEAGDCLCNECGNRFIVTKEGFFNKKTNKAAEMMKKDASDVDKIKTQQEELRKKAEALKAKSKVTQESSQYESVLFGEKADFFV